MLLELALLELLFRLEKRTKRKGGALLTLQDLDKMHGQTPVEMNAAEAQAKPYNAEQIGEGREIGAGQDVGAGRSGTCKRQ